MKKFLGYLDKKKKEPDQSTVYHKSGLLFAAKKCNVIVYRPSIKGCMLK